MNSSRVPFVVNGTAGFSVFVTPVSSVFLEWREAGKRSVAPYLVVPGAVALNAEPPVYVEEAGGLIGPVRLGLSARLAGQFLSAPAIPQRGLIEGHVCNNSVSPACSP